MRQGVYFFNPESLRFIERVLVCQSFSTSILNLGPDGLRCWVEATGTSVQWIGE